MVAKQLNLLAIVGPTASGKTGLAIEIAKQMNGEIIAADSRTVYKGLDIGTAKPSLAEQQTVPHYGLDLVGPGQQFSVADFKTYTDTKIMAIQKQGKLPLLVGGTGLYIDAVLYDFSFAPPNHELREQLDNKGIIELQAMITEAGLPMPENKDNKRYLIRTLERGTLLPDKKPLLPKTVIIGLNPDKATLKQRITERAHLMLKQGVLSEVEWGIKTYGLESTAMTGGVYRIFRDVIRGKLTEEQAVELFVTSDLQLAKRQLTWFRRNPDIIWFDSADAAYTWFRHEFIGTLK